MYSNLESVYTRKRAAFQYKQNLGGLLTCPIPSSAYQIHVVFNTNSLQLRWTPEVWQLPKEGRTGVKFIKNLIPWKISLFELSGSSMDEVIFKTIDIFIWCDSELLPQYENLCSRDICKKQLMASFLNILATWTHE